MQSNIIKFLKRLYSVTLAPKLQTLHLNENIASFFHYKFLKTLISLDVNKFFQ